MSHFTTIQVQIQDGKILQRCLQELGYHVEENATVRGYKNQTIAADYVIRQKNGYDLGFRRQGNSYELVADFWGAQIKPEEFIQGVTQKYAYKTLMVSVAEQGFQVEQEEQLEDGTLRVVVGKWM
jgi:hypothetical protein